MARAPRKSGCRLILLRAAGWGVLAALVAGCPAVPDTEEPVRLDTTGVEPGVDYSDLAAVVEEAFVQDRSLRECHLIIPYAVNRKADRLDAQLKRLAVTGPTATPALLATGEDRLAYWYNARAAWALKLAMLHGLPEEIDCAVLNTRAFPLDGRTMTLREIDEVLARDDDWRTLVASPGVLMGRACLPERPFTSGDVRQRIANRIEQLIDDDRRFVIDVGRREVRVPRVLWRFRRRIIDDYHVRYNTRGATLTTALLPSMSGSPLRRLQDAIGYRCVPAPPCKRIAREE